MFPVAFLRSLRLVLLAKLVLSFELLCDLFGLVQDSPVSGLICSYMLEVHLCFVAACENVESHM